MQQEKAQADLDWARKLDKAEREAYSRHEAIITQLSKSRDKVTAISPPHPPTHPPPSPTLPTFEFLHTYVIAMGCGCDEVRL